MPKRLLEPNTTLYPVPVVLITTGTYHAYSHVAGGMGTVRDDASAPNVMTCNRIASCFAEPPRLAISVRPMRYSHSLIKQTREFVVNVPSPAQKLLTDYVGVVTGKNENKIEIASLKLAPASFVTTPLLADCPVNIECVVEQEIELDSHTMFIGLVKAVHVEESLMDANGDVDFAKASGIVYESGVVRERPTYNFKVKDLRLSVQ